MAKTKIVLELSRRFSEDMVIELEAKNISDSKEFDAELEVIGQSKFYKQMLDGLRRINLGINRQKISVEKE